MRSFNVLYISITILWLTCISCQNDFLDAKPDKALLIPETIEDFDALMDNNTVFNVAPALQVLSADNFYTTFTGWQGWYTPMERNSYLWAADIYEGFGSQPGWNKPYEQVFYANVVLDGLGTTDKENIPRPEYNRLRGTALFHRAFAFFNLAQTFTQGFWEPEAPGIPIKVRADVNQHASRGTVKQTYDQITADLKEAETLLPKHADIISRPSGLAAQALLARVYMSMELYDSASYYANASLSNYSKLLDYNLLDTVAENPFPTIPDNLNEEVIFYAPLISYTFQTSSLTLVDTQLLASYQEGDLRRRLFFKPNDDGDMYFTGSYTGTSTFFGGLTTAELYLIRAECLARAGNYSAAMADLNTVLRTRWISGSFIPVTAEDNQEALMVILAERRKELVGRGLRWSDLKRLNRDSRLAQTLTRRLNGETYSLPPEDPRYLFPIPEEEIKLSGLEQNPR